MKRRFPVGVLRGLVATTSLAIVLVAYAAPSILDSLAGNAPIVFHGKVIDGFGQAVPHAKVNVEIVKLNWSTIIPVPRFNIPRTTRLFEQMTDEHGNFTVSGEHGVCLRVVNVTKPGYGHLEGDRFQFDYGKGIAPLLPVHVPDRGKPVVFIFTSKND